MNRPHHARPAFSLVELLVVIAIVAVLIALAVPAVQVARESANRAVCSHNLHEVGVALHSHHAIRGKFPTGALNDYYPWGPKRLTWAHALLPYLEQGNAARKFNPDLPPYWNAVWYNNANSLGANAPTSLVFPALRCPSDTLGIRSRKVSYPGYGFMGEYATTNYLAFFGGLNYNGAWHASAQQRGAFGVNFATRLHDITDGPSNTLAFGEYLTGLPQYEYDFRGSLWSDQPGYSQLYTQHTPNSSSPDLFYWDALAVYAYNRPDLNRPAARSVPGQTDTAAARSMHRRGVNTLFCDGSVRFIRDSIDVGIWRALGTAAGGEPLSGNF